MDKYVDLDIFAKSTKEYELVFYKNGVVADITDWTIYFTVKENMEDSDINAKITKAITSHTSPTAGKTTLSLTSSDTNLDGSYYYEISYLDDESNQDVTQSGRITFKKPTLQSRS